MTDRRTAAADLILRRLDAPAMPDEAFVRSSALALRGHAARARAEDRSPLGRLRRDVRGLTNVWRPAGRGALVGATALLALLLLAGLIVVLVGGGPKRPPPFGLAENGRIAFVEGYHIYTSDPLGGDLRQLTSGRRRDGASVLSGWHAHRLPSLAPRVVRRRSGRE